MRKRWLPAVLILAVIIPAGLVLYLRAPDEPRYDGKPLGYWLKAYNPLHATETSRQQADKAVAEVGTNAIPTLLKMLQARDSPLKLKLAAAAQWLHLTNRDFQDAERKQECAAAAFAALGGRARGAVPALIALYERNISATSRTYILLTLWNLGPAAREAGPLLVRWTATGDYPNISIFSAWRTVHPAPESAMPVLLKLLTNSSPRIRLQAADILPLYAPAALEALPALDNLRRYDPDGYVRETADSAHERLKPGSSIIPQGGYRRVR